MDRRTDFYFIKKSVVDIFLKISGIGSNNEKESDKIFGYFETLSMGLTKSIASEHNQMYLTIKSLKEILLVAKQMKTPFMGVKKFVSSFFNISEDGLGVAEGGEDVDQDAITIILRSFIDNPHPYFVIRYKGSEVKYSDLRSIIKEKEITLGNIAEYLKNNEMNIYKSARDPVNLNEIILRQTDDVVEQIIAFCRE